MRRKLILAAVIIAAFAGTYAWKKTRSKSDLSPSPRPTTHSRIVSLAPSITEILFTLGLGDSVVGVTRYCDYPPEARQKTEVGGYTDPNIEAIIALKPDLVISFPEHELLRKQMEKIHVPTLTVNHETIAEIMNSISTIAKTCGAERRAADLTRDINARMERVRRLTAGRPKPKVMISVGRNMGAGKVTDMLISGRGGFYHEMIELAGGRNAYSGDVAFPVISKEGIMRMDPEVIIDMIPKLEQTQLSRNAVLAEWQHLADVAAVKNGRVHLFDDDYVVVPGPRFILILEQMALLLHPEIEWGIP